jgi:hypothetical protein
MSSTKRRSLSKGRVERVSILNSKSGLDVNSTVIRIRIVLSSAARASARGVNALRLTTHFGCDWGNL